MSQKTLEGIDGFEKIVRFTLDELGFKARINRGRVQRISPPFNGKKVNFDFNDQTDLMSVECTNGRKMQPLNFPVPDPNCCCLAEIAAHACLGFERSGVNFEIDQFMVCRKMLVGEDQIEERLSQLRTERSGQVIKSETVERKKAVPWVESWDKLIDHLVGEKDVRVGEFWELPAKLSGFLVDLKLYSNEHSARTFLGIAIKRGLVKRIGSRNGRDTRWYVFNLPWPDRANGKTIIAEETPAPASENSGPSVDLMVSEMLESIDDKKKLQEWLEKVFGDNPEMARAFAEKSGRQIELLEKAKKAADLYADFTAGMKSL